MKINRWLLHNQISDVDEFIYMASHWGAPHALAEYPARLCYKSTDKCGKVPTFLKNKILDVNHFDVLEHGGVTIRFSDSYWAEVLRNHDWAKYCLWTEKNGAVEVFANHRVLKDMQWWYDRDFFESYFPAIFGIDPNLAIVGDIFGESVPSLSEGQAVVTLLAYDDTFPGDIGRATWLVEGVSLNMTHQFVRHRLFSFSQESKRYVGAKKGEWDFIYPRNATMYEKELLRRQYQASLDTYFKLINSGVKKEDARFVLPTATETRLVASSTGPGLRHFFNLRRAKAAQWEIRSVANMMYDQLKQVTEHYV